MLPSFECCSRERPSSSLDEVPFETLTKEPGEHLPTRWGQGGDTWGFTEPEDSAHQAFDLGADAGPASCTPETGVHSHQRDSEPISSINTATTTMVSIDDWVTVVRGNKLAPYFWNRTTGVTTKSPPQGFETEAARADWPMILSDGTVIKDGATRLEKRRQESQRITTEASTDGSLGQSHSQSRTEASGEPEARSDGARVSSTGPASKSSPQEYERHAKVKVIWSQPGPLGLKFKPVSLDSRDAPEGVCVAEVVPNAPGPVPRSIVGMRVSNLQAAGGSHRGLTRKSYNHVMDLIRESERPVSITFVLPDAATRRTEYAAAGRTQLETSPERQVASQSPKSPTELERGAQELRDKMEQKRSVSPQDHERAIQQLESAIKGFDQKVSQYCEQQHLAERKLMQKELASVKGSKSTSRKE